MSGLADTIRTYAKQYQDAEMRDQAEASGGQVDNINRGIVMCDAGDWFLDKSDELLAALEERDKLSATEELQSWLYEEKSHSVRITHDNGYGATNGWEVELTFGVHHVSAFEYASNNQYRDVDPHVVTIQQEWPGLDWTIRKAIELARAALQPTPETTKEK